VRGNAFAPGTIRVRAGATVTWTNRDSVPHNVTFMNGGASGTLGQGQSYSHTFTQPGTYDYHCTFHPGMIGRVVVVG
jgi:amicyanin